MPDFVAPEVNLAAFTCLHCGTLAQQEWKDLYYLSAMATNITTPITRVECTVCREHTYWHRTQPIHPIGQAGPPAHSSTPENVRSLYDEARMVAGPSARSAAALLRLALQELLRDLSGKGNINDAIGDLVRRGLDADIQRAMDYVRVVGNNAVHPGELQLEEDGDLVPAMFEMINLVVDQVIARPARIRGLFDKLPEGARAGIERRDQDVTSADGGTS